MSEASRITVRWLGEGNIPCQIDVAGAEGLDILTKMLKGDIMWADGAVMLTELLPPVVQHMAVKYLDAIIQSEFICSTVVG